MRLTPDQALAYFQEHMQNEWSKFPEAFRRFENDVIIGNLKSYHQLTLAFRWWAGQRWKGTSKQWSALNREARNLGFAESERFGYRKKSRYSGRATTTSNVTWREETVKIKGKSRIRYRDLETGRFIKKP